MHLQPNNDKYNINHHHHHRRRLHRYREFTTLNVN